MTTIKIGDPVKILAGQGDTSYCGLEANMYRFKGELAEVISLVDSDEGQRVTVKLTNWRGKEPFQWVLRYEPRHLELVSL
jgi:hypothetical protein